MSIEINSVTKYFDRTEVLHDVNLDVASGEMVALLGFQDQVKQRFCVLLLALNIKPKEIFVSRGKMLVDYMLEIAKSVLFFSTMHCFAI